MISEEIREADELEHLVLSRWLRKVKDLQSILWGERGACRGDEVTEADELEHLVLSRGLRKVKDLQSILWGERGACRGDEVTDVFDLWETKLCFLGVDSDILSA